MGLFCGGRPPAPQSAEERDVHQHVAMIEQGPVPGPALHHIKPVKVPNEAPGGPVKPLPTGAAHEISLRAPHEEEEQQPGAEEVGEDEAGQQGREERQSGETGGDEDHVPQEVHHRGGRVLLLLVRQEGAQGAVVHGDGQGDGRGRAQGLHH